MVQKQLEELLKYPASGTLIGAPNPNSFTNRTHSPNFITYNGPNNPNRPNGNDIIVSSYDDSKSYLMSPGSENWILIAACIGLSLTTLLLVVCYCQAKRQVNRLIRQSSVSSGNPILNKNGITGVSV